MLTDRFSWIGEPLYASQLEDALNKHIPKVFGGVWAKDQLPTLEPTHYPVVYVVNTDNHNRPGKHWTVFVCQKNQCDFFDSYGCPPDIYGKEFADFSQRYGTFKHQPRWLQGLTSVVCGHYCLFYLCHRFHLPTCHALSIFKQNRFENDQFVHAWTHDHFPSLTFANGQKCQNY